MTEREAAIEAAKAAGKVIREHFGGLIEVTAKHGNPQDLVTNIDKVAEQAILSTLRKDFGDYSTFSEESGEQLRGSEKRWLVDPLDSTTNFTRLVPCSSTSIALLDRSQVMLGVVYLPFTDELYLAERGKGATLNGQSIKVSSTPILDRAFASVEWYSRSPEFQERGIATFQAFASRVSKIRYLSATIFEIVRVASGHFDFQVCDTHYLDTAAAGLIVTEAGGRITDDHGNALDSTNQNVVKVVASNGVLHDVVVEVLNKV